MIGTWNESVKFGPFCCSMVTVTTPFGSGGEMTKSETQQSAGMTKLNGDAGFPDSAIETMVVPFAPGVVETAVMQQLGRFRRLFDWKPVVAPPSGPDSTMLM